MGSHQFLHTIMSRMTSLAKPVPIRCVLLVPLALGLLRVSGGFTLIFFSGRLFLSQAAMQALPPAHFDMFLLPRIMVKTCLLLLPGGLILPFNFAERTGKAQGTWYAIGSVPHVKALASTFQPTSRCRAMQRYSIINAKCSVIHSCHGHINCDPQEQWLLKITTV